MNHGKSTNLSVQIGPGIIPLKASAFLVYSFLPIIPSGIFLSLKVFGLVLSLPVAVSTSKVSPTAFQVLSACNSTTLPPLANVTALK